MSQVNSGVTQPQRSTTAQRIQAVCACITAVAAVVGVVGLLWQSERYQDQVMRDSRRDFEQIQRDSQRRTDEALCKLYAADVEFHKYLGANDLHGIFFPSKNETLWRDEKNWRKRVESNLQARGLIKLRAACQMMANLLESYLLLEDSLSGETRLQMRPAWRQYISWTYERNPFFREYMEETRPTWTQKFNDLLDAEKARLTQQEKK